MTNCVMFLVEVKIVGIQENKIILLNCTQRGLSPFGSKDAKIDKKPSLALYI